MVTVRKGERGMNRGRYFVTFAILLTSAIVLIVGVFAWLYSTARENLVNMWKVNTVQMARDVEYYLTCPRDAVVFASRHVEEMMRRGATNAEIQEYLINETEVYAATVDSNTTGVYGYVRGEYLDGSGWVPNPDYDATARPWYIRAKGAGGETAFVRPYLNLQTYRHMMSVSRLLYDGQSVVSMDIFLDGVQKMALDMRASDQVDVAMVIDKSGFIVTHSTAAEIGRDYLGEDNIYEKALAERVLAEEEATFTIEGLGGSQRVFAKRINSQWTAVLIVSEAKMLGSIKRFYIISALTLVMVILTLVGIFIIVSRKYEETEQLNREMQAAAEIYDAMYLIDLKADTLRPLRPDQALEWYLKGDYTHCREKLAGAVPRMASESAAQMLESFMNLSTLDERMGTLRSISQEYLDSAGRWTRMRFVAVSHDENRLHELLWALESIDEDRRRQEHLKHLAETDAMTQIRNRNSGEVQIKTLLKEGINGMFLLLDVDRFKSINDNFGHAVGDQVLIAVAGALRTSMRMNDIVFRMGGDEFAAFAPGVRTEEIASRVVGRLLHNVDEIRISGLNVRDVHVSIGVTFTEPGMENTFEALYLRADRGMYTSKQNGLAGATYVYE